MPKWPKQRLAGGLERGMRQETVASCRSEARQLQEARLGLILP